MKLRGYGTRSFPLTKNGWFIQDPSPCSSGLWKGILAAKEVYMKQVRLRVGRGDKICFLTDLWVVKNTLAYTFPELFSYATNQEAIVIKGKDDQVSWGPMFKRNLKEVESQFCSMLAILGSVFVPKEGKD